MHVGCVGYVYLCVCVTPPPIRHFKQLTLSSVCVFPFSTPRTGAGSHEEPCQERPIHFQLSACLAGMKSLLGFDKTFIKAQHGRGPAPPARPPRTDYVCGCHSKTEIDTFSLALALLTYSTSIWISLSLSHQSFKKLVPISVSLCLHLFFSLHPCSQTQYHLRLNWN